MLMTGEAKHQQVGWGPGPSWKRPAASFHGARYHGNQTSAAGLQQSQERQAPFLSISQESTGGGRGTWGQSELSELGCGGGGGHGGHLPAQWAGHKLPECGTLFHASVPFLREPALPHLPGARPAVIRPHSLPPDPSKQNPSCPPLATRSKPALNSPICLVQRSSEKMMVVRAQAPQPESPEFKSQLCHAHTGDKEAIYSV